MSRLLEKLRLDRFRFLADETMQGSHRFEPGMGPPGRHPMRFDVTWGPDHMADFLSRGDGFMTARLEGTVTVGGLCDGVLCSGTIALRYLDEHEIEYSFRFAVDGQEYLYNGKKVNIRPWNLPVSHTTCTGILREADSGRLVSRSVTHFRLATLPAFLTSFRLARAS